MIYMDSDLLKNFYFLDGNIKLFIIFEGEIPKELINNKNNIFCIPLLSEKHNLF